ncbi:nucleotide sugar dehydrogenase [Bacillus inaquosorum]|uniref:Nucleotide sugar dehydrogenase n=1 Tax=Bacillus inaquosorum KCTC 13429 TaxID=1236548 RepID=A0A9W5LLK7_9BACI|nr:nucleotide sugar dehydrogenase [Bacillus inaquosorum]RKQ25082.1 nucleotide sugar dehydrogenase [Bacillus subtilis]AWM18666.1 nucleotide sugar dehydrogenase [Bacillus inaquosorum]ELS62841.1 nucleotide sugar dehydrogenase [Bacillus inaquosorum KCTC 13429]MCY7906985.1 nucleotide sugar dehydrogenase [Bacillus inaquosorum]MCY7930799.1 nucleotide sugar dehydrogenase [Bacillus inaquosorum]
MKVCVIGLGYIGLPTSVMFAKYGAEVVGVDVHPHVVESLNKGEAHLEEPGLQELLNEALENKKFKAQLVPEPADAFIIAVPTPNNLNDNMSCDLTYVLQAVESTIPYIRKGSTIIVESTIAPRSIEDYVQPLLEKNGFTIGEDIYLVHCPERVMPGNIFHELINNMRIIGGITPSCSDAGEKIYRTFVKSKIVKTDAKTAEMSKLMENTFRDVNIALANELTKICNDLHINALDVIEMANMHPRVNIHSPGPGVGGHCLAVDPYFIVAKAPETADLISRSRSINSSMPFYIVEKVKKIMEIVNGRTITIGGLAYKGDIDDIRESPALEILEMLKSEKDYEVRAYDPYVYHADNAQNLKEALRGSDLFLILTDHSHFKTIHDEDINRMANKVIFDTRNIVLNVPVDCEYFNLGSVHEFLNKPVMHV